MSSFFLSILIAVVVLGLAPLIASTFLQSRGVYRIDVVVRSADRRLAKGAQISTSIGSEVKEGNGYWEILIPAETRPSDRRVQIFASEDGQSGESTVKLDDGFYVQTAIDLLSPAPAFVRGVVKDSKGAPASGVHVFIPGYQDGTTTDTLGSFLLPAHSPEGQMVTVKAEKAGWATQETLPVGASADLTLRKGR